MDKRGHQFADLPIAPQIVRNVPLLTFFLPASSGIGAEIPEPLSPHRQARLILNMWFLSDAQQMTGFGAPGPMGVAYLAAEVAGEEGGSADGTNHFPARFWLRHWSSSPAARAYADQASGLLIEPGDVVASTIDGVMNIELKLQGRSVVKASARIGDRSIGTASGHSIYYAERDGTDGREVARFQVPWVSDAYTAQDPSVKFSFPDDPASPSYVSNGPQAIAAVSFRRITLVPYLSSGIVSRSDAPRRNLAVAQ
jgi:hypothetical protein